MHHYLVVAKKKSLFDDRPVEIQELTYIIKQDINNLNQQLAQLQEVRAIIIK
jgi:syntaxin 5